MHRFVEEFPTDCYTYSTFAWAASKKSHFSQQTECKSYFRDVITWQRNRNVPLRCQHFSMSYSDSLIELIYIQRWINEFIDCISVMLLIVFSAREKKLYAVGILDETRSQGVWVQATVCQKI